MAVQRRKDQEFSIFYREDYKEVRYRTQTPDDCSEILAKLKFLRSGQGVGGNQRRMPTGTLQPQKFHF